MSAAGVGTSYRCAYCGTQQTWDGAGARVCSHCGATQPEAGSPPVSTAPVPARNGARVLMLLLALAIIVALVVWGVHASSKPSTKSITATAPSRPLKSRIVVVDNPQVRLLAAGSDLSSLDILRSAPANAGTLFDTKALSLAQPRGMNDTDGDLYFVGEVTNHSPDATAIAPAAALSLIKRGRVIETTDLNFSDLPPGGHSPAYFTWSGEPTDFDHVEIHWKPVQGFAASSPGHPRLQATITDRKMTPGTVTSITSAGTGTFHFMSASVKGTVVNRGDAAATGVQLYLTLRDAQGRVTGFKEKNLSTIAPGESIDFDIDADQWAEPVASLSVEALSASDPVLK